MKDQELRYNGSGYRDDTAYQAIRNIIKDEKEAEKQEKDRKDDTGQ